MTLVNRYNNVHGKRMSFEFIYTWLGIWVLLLIPVWRWESYHLWVLVSWFTAKLTFLTRKWRGLNESICPTHSTWHYWRPGKRFLFCPSFLLHLPGSIVIRMSYNKDMQKLFEGKEENNFKRWNIVYDEKFLFPRQTCQQFKFICLIDAATFLDLRTEQKYDPTMTGLSVNLLQKCWTCPPIVSPSSGKSILPSNTSLLALPPLLAHGTWS